MGPLIRKLLTNYDLTVLFYCNIEVDISKNERYWSDGDTESL